ncbi:hypothetical protein IMAU10033_00769 [Lactobacillus helveticus]|nr:hypothetical protein [Lactobacillus helveticus]
MATETYKTELKTGALSMNLNRVKRMVPAQVGDRTAYEVDRDGKWKITWGTPITINDLKFFFAPIPNAKGVSIQAYSLDSLKLFRSQQISLSFKEVYLNCATEADFIKTVMPMIVRIDKALREPKSDGFWRDFLQNEYLAAIIECGARNEKERRLLKKFAIKETRNKIKKEHKDEN